MFSSVDVGRNPVITINGIPINWKNQGKYLGIILDSKLTWSPYVKYISSYFHCSLSNIKYLLNSINITNNTKLLLTKTLLFPIILYASPVWAYLAHTPDLLSRILSKH